MVITRREILLDPANDKSSQRFDKEFLVANGLGGYASLSIYGNLLRKYHGLLIAALPAPLGRTIMLNYVEDSLTIGEGETIYLSELDLYEPEIVPVIPLKKFTLEDGLPIWTYSTKDITLEKRIFMDYMKNATYITYELIHSSNPVVLNFRPFFHFRHHEASPSVDETQEIKYIQEGLFCEFQVPSFPALSIKTNHPVKLVEDKKILKNVRYRFEEERGYESKGSLKSPCCYMAELRPGESLTFLASTENRDQLDTIAFDHALHAEKKRRERLVEIASIKKPSVKSSSFTLDLLLASDQFIIVPFTRYMDVVLNKIQGEDARTIIAGYHWFTDWGRDTMISLEGLLLETGRIQEARYVLYTYSQHIKDGLIPNMFPDKENEGRYNTADATLWFFHAIDRYITYSKDYELLKDFLPHMKEILRQHIKGTRFGIHVDLDDGLLHQGMEGYALTWMDAVVGDLVVTPRRGKAVEINALWYNALSLTLEWMEHFGEVDEEFKRLAEQCYTSFNKKFWIPEKKYLYDIIEGEKGDDPALRPNQIFAISLKYPILKKEYWDSVIQNVYDKLFTVVGLRTLSPEHPDFKVAYQGNLFLRDSAYHQGTVWPWLMGPFIDAWLKTYPERVEEAQMFIQNFDAHLNDGAIGYISEIFDAEKPYSHRGCIAQAWSVAEILRSWIKICDIILKAKSSNK